MELLLVAQLWRTTENLAGLIVSFLHPLMMLLALDQTHKRKRTSVLLWKLSCQLSVHRFFCCFNVGVFDVEQLLQRRAWSKQQRLKNGENGVRSAGLKSHPDISRSGMGCQGTNGLDKMWILWASLDGLLVLPLAVSSRDEAGEKTGIKWLCLHLQIV